MVTAVWITFGVTYGASLIGALVFVGLEPELAAPLFVPLIGAGISGQFLISDGSGDPEPITFGMLAWLCSMIQTTSFVIALVGHRQRHNRNRGRGGAESRGFTVASGPGDRLGLSVAGWF
jgi:hypothetical protein